MSRNKGLPSIHNLPPTEANKRKEKVSGAPSHCPPDSVPQTPSGELRPLHPLLENLYPFWSTDNGLAGHIQEQTCFYHSNDTLDAILQVWRICNAAWKGTIEDDVVVIGQI